MSDDSPPHSGPDSPTSSSGVDNKEQRKSPDSLTAFESHYVNFSAAHHHAMAAQAAMAAAAGLAGPSGSGKKATVNNNLVNVIMQTLLILSVERNVNSTPSAWILNVGYSRAHEG